MTRNVFDIAGACHAWAHGNIQARSGNGNVFADGGRLYSYGRHFPIAAFLTADRETVLLNADSYSISTSRHQRYAADATRHLNQISVPDLRGLVESIWGRWYAESAEMRASRAAAFLQWATQSGDHIRALESAAVREGRHGLAAPGSALPVLLEWAEVKPAAFNKAAAARLKQEARDKAAAAKAASLAMDNRARIAAMPTADGIKGRIAAILRTHQTDNARGALESLSRDLLRMQKHVANRRGFAKVHAALKADRATVRAALEDFDRLSMRANARRIAREGLRDLKAIRAWRRDLKAAGRIADPVERALAMRAADSHVLTLPAGNRGDLQSGIVPGASDINGVLDLARRPDAIAKAAAWVERSRGGWDESRAIESLTNLQLAHEAERQEAARVLSGEAPKEAAEWLALAQEARERAALVAELALPRALKAPVMPAAMRAAWERAATNAELIAAPVIRERQARHAAIMRAREAERLERERETRESWLAGASVRFYARDALGGAYLRAVNVQRDESGAITGGELQTSQGATVPLVHAIRAFRFLKHVRETGREWKRNGRTLRVGHYQVDSVLPSGDFHAGCHFIRWEQVAALAERLGLADLAPADVTEHSRAVA